MNKKSIFWSIVSIAVAMAFVMPVAAFGVISNNENTNDIENMVKSTTNTINAPSRGTIYVDDDADPSWYDATHVKTIREGITNATIGDTVYVYNGTYNENEILTVDKQLELVGESRENVIVIGGGFMSHVFSINARDVIVSNFTVTNGKSGIYINNVYVSINNCDSYGNNYGIYVYQVSCTNIINCNIYNNTMGIYLYSSYDNILRDNAMYNNTYNFCIHGKAISEYYQDIDASNTIDGKILYWLVGESDRTLDETDNAGFISLIGCTNITIEPSDPEALAEMDVQGIMLIDTVGSTISGVDVHNCYDGILFMESPNNDIINCNVYSNYRFGIFINSYSNNCDVTTSYSYNNGGDGIFLDLYSSNCNITNCGSYSNSNKGILLDRSLNSNIINCDVYNNYREGLYLSSSPGCTVINCNLYNNYYGIYIRRSSNSELKDNNISDNACNFLIEGDVVSENPDDFYCDIDNSNTINGKPIYYFVEQQGITLDETNNFGYLGLVSCTDITAKNSDVFGVLLVNTTYSTVSNVTSHNSGTGIYTWLSSNNNIIDCTVYDCGYGIYLASSSYSNVINCTVHDTYNHALYLMMSSYNEIINCEVYNGYYNGIYARTSPHNNITNCNSYGNGWHGIQIYSESPWCNVLNCSAYDNNRDGIQIFYSNFCNVLDSIVYNNNENGIYLNRANYGNVINCHSYNNDHGITIKRSSVNNIIDNNVSSNIVYGFYIWYNSNSNTIYHNNFVNDQNLYVDSGVLNTWDNGYPSGGNYWSDYSGEDNNHGPGQDIPGSDGIGDSPYLMDGENQDNYPFMEPYVPPILIEITTLSYKWNIIASPFSYSVDKADIIVEYDGTDYTWADAVSGGIIANALFGWDRINQIYLQSDVLEPGCGYWLWSYNDCILKVLGSAQELGSDGIGDMPSFMFIEITALSYKWNIIAAPFNYSVDKADIIVEYDGTDYAWADAVSGGIIANALFGWDRISQIYLQSDVLDPGCGYWLWSYNDCILKYMME